MIGTACVFEGKSMEASCAKTVRGRMAMASMVLGIGLAVSSTDLAWGFAPGDPIEKCTRIVHADVVALDQCLVFNRYGTALPDGMLFALRRDVVPAGGNQQPGQPLSAGKVNLACNKRRGRLCCEPMRAIAWRFASLICWGRSAASPHGRPACTCKVSS